MATLFQAPEFLQHSNIYEVNIRQYTPEGTFKAFAAHLPRLRDMGIEILWFMPIHPIGATKRKGSLGSYYSIQDHKAVNPEFGTTEDLKDLITKIHALDMKIVIDWVANHTSWDNVWTIANPEYFVKDDAGNFKPPFDWDDVLQLDHSNKEQQAAMINAMQYWITEFNIDGFRADLAHLTPLPFWKGARLKLSPFKKDLVWLAETEDISYHEAFDISFTWQWMHAAQKLAKNEISLKKCLEILQNYKADFPPVASRLFFTSNHDENSWNGTEYEKYGNYAKALAVFACTYPGIPLIYSGQELPLKKRLKFFDKDVIDWDAEIELHDFYKKLLHLKTNSAALSAASEATFFMEAIDKNVLGFALQYDTVVVLVFLNMGAEAFDNEINLQDIEGSFKDIFTAEAFDIRGEYRLSAAPGEFRVFEKAKG